MELDVSLQVISLEEFRRSWRGGFRSGVSVPGVGNGKRVVRRIWHLSSKESWPARGGIAFVWAGLDFYRTFHTSCVLVSWSLSMV